MMISGFGGLRLSLALRGNRGGGGFQISDLFRGGADKGFYLKPSDLTRMWQDVSATTPVTSSTDPVARIDSQLGPASVISALQSTNDNRPLYDLAAGVSSLSFDATNDQLIAALSFSGDAAVTVVCAANTKSSASIIFEYSSNYNGNAGSFVVGQTILASRDWFVAMKGATTGSAGYGTPTAGADYDAVLSCVFDFAGGGDLSTQVQPRLNGSVPVLTNSGGTTAQDGSGFGDYDCYIGSRDGPSLVFSDKIKGLFVINRRLSASEIVSAETAIASDAGITF